MPLLQTICSPPCSWLPQLPLECSLPFQVNRKVITDFVALLLDLRLAKLARQIAALREKNMDTFPPMDLLARPGQPLHEHLANVADLSEAFAARFGQVDGAAPWACCTT